MTENPRLYPTKITAYCPYCGTLNTEEHLLTNLLQDKVYALECRGCGKDSVLILYDFSSTSVTEPDTGVPSPEVGNKDVTSGELQPAGHSVTFYTKYQEVSEMAGESEWGKQTKLKRITLDVYYEETRAIEDIIWCKNSDEELEKMYSHLRSFWRKFAAAYDEKGVILSTRQSNKEGDGLPHLGIAPQEPY